MFLPILIATVAMVFTDVSGTIMVIAESKNRGWLAGMMDTFQWLVGITTTAITVTILQGHSLEEKILVIAFVSAANLLGTWLGVYVGHRFVKDKNLEQRLTALESVILTNQHN
jgi:hypothetical protein